MKLSPDNYTKGFLIDHEWMAGVSQTETGYLAFIVDILSGEQVGAHQYERLEDALASLSAMNREWTFETTSSCGSGSCSGERCGEEKCKKEGCSIYEQPSP